MYDFYISLVYLHLPDQRYFSVWYYLLDIFRVMCFLANKCPNRNIIIYLTNIQFTFKECFIKFSFVIDAIFSGGSWIFSWISFVCPSNSFSSTRGKSPFKMKILWSIQPNIIRRHIRSSLSVSKVLRWRNLPLRYAKACSITTLHCESFKLKFLWRIINPPVTLKPTIIQGDNLYVRSSYAYLVDYLHHQLSDTNLIWSVYVCYMIDSCNTDRHTL